MQDIFFGNGSDSISNKWIVIPCHYNCLQSRKVVWTSQNDNKKLVNIWAKLLWKRKYDCISILFPLIFELKNFSSIIQMLGTNRLLWYLFFPWLPKSSIPLRFILANFNRKFVWICPPYYVFYYFLSRLYIGSSAMNF